MATTGNMIPGYRVWEYMLVIRPHEELQQRIAVLRQSFSKEYKVEGKPSAHAQLVLASFNQYEMMEDRICNRLQHVAMACPPFRVELNDYGSFPAHTIYIHVATRAPLQELVRTIRSETGRLMKRADDQKPHFITDPHITMGTKLKPWQYEKGWLEYHRRSFHGKFIAAEMILLRRAEGEARFHPYRQFEFRNLPVVTKQGELFG